MFRFLAAVMTRYTLAAAFCVTLTAGDLAQLQRLEEKSRMFELSDACCRIAPAPKVRACAAPQLPYHCALSESGRTPPV